MIASQSDLEKMIRSWERMAAARQREAKTSHNRLALLAEADALSKCAEHARRVCGLTDD